MRHWLCLPLLLISLSSHAASTFRCASKLVSLDDHIAEVQNKCGNPADRSSLGYKEVADRYGYWQSVPIEEWTYGPDHGMYHVLRFEGNRLRKIDSQRGN